MCNQPLSSSAFTILNFYPGAQNSEPWPSSPDPKSRYPNPPGTMAVSKGRNTEVYVEKISIGDTNHGNGDNLEHFYT